MKYIRFILIIGISFLLLNCIGKQDHLVYVQPDFNRNSVITSDTLGNVLFISRFDFDPQDNLYVFDDNSYSVRKYDSLGYKVKQIGRKGQGPKEFDKNDFHFLQWGHSEIIVYNLEKHKLSFFNPDLDLIKSKYFKTPFYHFDYNRDGMSVFSFLDHKKDGALRLYKDSEFVQKDVKFDLELEFSNLYFNILKLRFMDGDKFIGGYVYKNKLEIFESKGDSKGEFSVPDWPTTSEVNEPYVPEKVMIQDITYTDENEIWILGGGYAKNRRRDIFVFDQDGGYKYTFTLPVETPQIIHKDGYLYTLNLDRSNVLRWDIDL